nr:hypothetical protein [Amycolatopsis sp. CA-230715]
MSGSHTSETVVASAAVRIAGTTAETDHVPSRTSSVNTAPPSGTS